MKKLRVAYCGTPDFAVPTLDLLLNHPHIDLRYDLHAGSTGRQRHGTKVPGSH